MCLGFYFIWRDYMNTLERWKSGDKRLQINVRGMNKKTVVVSAFPACGKSYVFENQSKISPELTCLDSDSSEFSWIKDENGNNTKERNPAFPDNYIQHIKENIGKVDIIFVSSHKDVVNALEDNEITWVKVVPDRICKEEWIGRFWLRGNDDNFISFISNNWDDFTDISNDYTYEFMTGTVKIQPTEYIENSLDFILNCTGNCKES